MFFLSPSFALFSHFTCTVPFPTSHESTVNVMLPSAQRIFDPGTTSFASDAYDTAIRFLFPLAL